MEDCILEEVRRIREEYAAHFNYDLKAICADLKRMEKESKGPRVSFGPRRVETPVSAAPVEITGSAK